MYKTKPEKSSPLFNFFHLHFLNLFNLYLFFLKCQKKKASNIIYINFKIYEKLKIIFQTIELGFPIFIILYFNRTTI